MAPPRPSPSAKKQPSILFPVGARPDMRVLIVEPKEELRGAAKSALMRMGFSRIIETANLDGGRRAFFPTEINLIICNFSLPDGSAANLLHDIRKMEACEHLPFVFLVSDIGGDIGQKAAAIPNCGVVATAFTPKELQQGIAKALGGTVPAPVEDTRRVYTIEQIPDTQLAICSDPVLEGDDRARDAVITLPGYENLRVMVIDSNKIHRIQMEDALTSLGFRDVKGVESSLVALKRIETGRVDFVLCEWNPDGLSGLELLRATRANELSNALPFVMFTGRADKEQVLRALRLRADDYVLKPISLSGLADTFNRVLMQEEINRKSGTTYKGICLNDQAAIETAEQMMKAAYSPNGTPESGLPDLRILMVDEDEKFRRICGSFLGRMGCIRRHRR